MSDEELICGCGGEIEIKIDDFSSKKYSLCPTHYLHCSNSRCPLCSTTTRYETQSEAIAAFKKATRADVKQGFCEWNFNKTDSRWDSSCEQSFCFFESDPKEFHYNFCPYCGKKINLPELKP